MVKNFTLQAITHQQKENNTGIICWNILDERNRRRKVEAVTELSSQGFIKAVKSSNKREMPLVEILSQYGEGDSFRIDFALFNQTFGYQPREVYPESQATPPTGNKLRDSLRALFQIPFRPR
ncbi:MAG TPA: hypothetical protein PLE99_15645 [Candidatus Thiothrix moscowensis]|uniref:hypothetical protein n=1 Tax=unclassified Thiothrix TaxID=2636184 RepID=UPI001A325E26|nr:MULTISPECIES: hypothetical protein [unclassified Thiothrix]MBJ6609924.1 hypothetical protein [Candidatus Thiothrix moscowensis]HRJ54192.1 hypothetical protein [Candidatus Thiothrix moscowensis]HRJ94458.1 hypothetical protein [Candidatus Thiothrix moscowensis]